MEKRNDIIKIVFTGPECSGKTTLSSVIADKLNIPSVKEYAREYLTHINRPYCYDDLYQIAKGQVQLEKKCIHKHPENKMIICDTNLQVIKIWSQVKFKKCHPFILNHSETSSYYVLCTPDFEWEYDPLRENKNNRLELFNKYLFDLQKTNKNFIITSGNLEERVNLVISSILKLT
tara:strand:+ start:4327 stop:4854 length:528 start_codon:yes stop_codon:yes gene_type:complete